jgi:hypothetical protein
MRFGHDASPESGGSATPQAEICAQTSVQFTGDACPSGGDGTSMRLAESESLLKIAQLPR